MRINRSIQVETKDLLKEKIKKLGTDELLRLETSKNILTPSKEKEEKIPNLTFLNSTPTFNEEKGLEPSPKPNPTEALNFKAPQKEPTNIFNPLSPYPNLEKKKKI